MGSVAQAAARRGLIVSYGNASGPVTGVELGVLAQQRVAVRHAADDVPLLCDARGARRRGSTACSRCWPRARSSRRSARPSRWRTPPRRTVELEGAGVKRHRGGAIVDAAYLPVGARQLAVAVSTAFPFGDPNLVRPARRCFTRLVSAGSSGSSFGPSANGNFGPAGRLRDVTWKSIRMLTHDADQRLAAAARRDGPGIATPPAACRGRAPIRAAIRRSIGNFDMVIGDRLARDHRPAAARRHRLHIAVELGVGRLAIPFGAVERHPARPEPGP